MTNIECKAKYVNDNHHKPNARTLLVQLDGKNQLCLFALRAIEPESEIHYNYDSRGKYPWRKRID